MSKFMSSTDLKGGNRFEPWKPDTTVYQKNLKYIKLDTYGEKAMREAADRRAKITNQAIEKMLNSEI